MKVFLKILLVVFTLSSTTAFASGMDGSCPYSGLMSKNTAYIPKDMNSNYFNKTKGNSDATSTQDKVTW